MPVGGSGKEEADKVQAEKASKPGMSAWLRSLVGMSTPKEAAMKGEQTKASKRLSDRMKEAGAE